MKRNSIRRNIGNKAAEGDMLIARKISWLFGGGIEEGGGRKPRKHENVKQSGVPATENHASSAKAENRENLAQLNMKAEI